MAKTVLRVRLDGVAFYMNTETSSPGTGHRNRYRLSRQKTTGAINPAGFRWVRWLARSCWK